ncbi:MAG: DUF1614 domain-containing protein [Halanaerobiales bacterium]
MLKGIDKPYITYQLRETYFYHYMRSGAMSAGVIILVLTSIIIYFGAAQRVLDRLYLSDTAALFIIALIIGGSFLVIPISKTPVIEVNVGGALIPFLLAVYVLIKTDTPRELIRTLAAVFITAVAIYTVSIVFRNFGEGRDIIDPLYMFALAAGLIAYLFGRSRRGAFVAGVLGFILYNLLQVWWVVTGKIYTEVRLGGAGAFDSIIISGLLAVLLAELIGESRERLQGGPVKTGGDDSDN